MSDDTGATSEAWRRSGVAPADRRTRGRTAAVAEGAVHHPGTPRWMVSEEGLATIEHNADTILEQVGIEFREAPTRSSC